MLIPISAVFVVVYSPALSMSEGPGDPDDPVPSGEEEEHGEEEEEEEDPAIPAPEEQKEATPPPKPKPSPPSKGKTPGKKQGTPAKGKTPVVKQKWRPPKTLGEFITEIKVIPHEHLLLDEKKEHGQVRNISDERLEKRFTDLKESPPAGLVRLLVNPTLSMHSTVSLCSCLI